MMLITSAAPTAVQNPSTWNAGINQLTSSSISPLMTSVNRPSVRMLIGSVSTTTSGRKEVLTSASRMAAAIIVCVSSIQIFRNIASTTSNATALMANLVTRTSTFRSMTLQVTTRGDGDATAELQLPLDRATDGVRDRVLDLLVGEYGVESVAQVVGSDLIRVLPVVVDAADVTHFALRDEHEHFRRVLGAVPARCPLGVVA